MPIFARNKERAVQSFILKVVNNNCPDMTALLEGPRADQRVNLSIAITVVPVKDGRPSVDEAFAAVTKEFSNTGLGLILDGPRGLDEVILGFRWERDRTFVLAKAKHLNPMGGGFYQLGFRMTDLVHVGDYPELDSLIV